MSSGPTPEEFRDFFAGILADLDANPRPAKARMLGDGLEIDLVDGNPVFTAGGRSVKADFRRRWLAEHPVPARPRRGAVFVFEPTSGNRVKVRIR